MNISFFSTLSSKLFLGIAILWINIKFLKAANYPQLVFSPSSLQQYDLRSQGGYSAKLAYAQNASLVFAATGSLGVSVLDSKTYQIISQINLNNQTITGLDVTSDGEYVMMGYQNKFSVFKYSNKNLTLLSQASFQSGVIMDVSLDQTETIAFGYGMPGQICAYNILNKNNIVFLTKFNTASNRVRQLYATLDNKYLLLADSTSGLNVIQVTNSQGNYQLKSIAVGTPAWDVMDVKFTNDYQIAYVADFFYGLFYINLGFVFNSDPSAYPLQLGNQFISYWPFQVESVNSLAITSNNNYLLVGQRGLGIKIIDISDKNNPAYYSDIPAVGHAFTILLVNNEQNIFFANSISIIVYGQSVLNLNDQYPNLYNGFQSFMYSPSKTLYYWKCIIGKNDTYFYGVFDDGGVYIMTYGDDPYNMQILAYIMYNPTDQTDFMWINEDETLMILGISTNQYTLEVFDITDKTKPKLITQITKTESNDTDGCVFTKDMTRFICANGGDGIFITDTTDIKNLKIIFTWPLESFMTGTVKDVVIKDNKYILGAIRNYGMCVLELTDPNTLVLRGYLQTNGGEGIALSNDLNYVYLKDGINGVTIVDIQNLPNIHIVGQVQLEGWEEGIVRLQNDNYLVALTTDAGYAALIDSSNKSTPYVISKYNPNKEIAYNGCTDSQENYIMILTNAGFRVLPIKTNLYIHTEIDLVTGQNSGQTVLTPLPKSQSLLIGQTIQFTFLILYPEKNIKINQILYVDNYEIKQIPYWMTYSSSSQILTMSIVKEALGSGNIQKSLNTVIIQTLKQISSTDFIYNQTNATTTADQSMIIYKYLRQIQYIDNNGYITTLFDPESDFQFIISGLTVTDKLQQQIKLTLARSFYQNPVVFYIESSLKINFQSSSDYITSQSSTITIYFLIDSAQGKFVSLSYGGVITSTTEKLEQIKLEGSIENINRALQFGIFISRIDLNNDINVQVTLQDGTNYDYQKTLNSKDISFIHTMETVQIGETLQSQINNWFPGSILDIATALNFQFSSSSFQCASTVTLQYSAFLQKGGSYIPLPSDFWLQFDKNTIKFYGSATTSQYGQTFYLRVNATDGYTYTYQDFYIIMNGLPFVYVFNLLVQVFGPVIAILGVFQYKYQIFNVILKKQTTYSPEIALVNKYFIKTFTVVGNDLLKARLIFQIFRENANRLSNNNQIPSRNDQNEKKFFKIESQESIKFEEQDITKSQAINNLRKVKRQKLLRNPKIDVTPYTSIIHTKNRMIIPHMYQRLYMNDDGSIRYGKIFRECVSMDIKYKIENKQYSVKDEIKEYKDRDSRFYICFKAIVSRYFLTIDEKTNAAYRYMKDYAIETFSYTKNDWYKAYVQVIHEKRQNKNMQLLPFPKVVLKDEMIKEVFFDLGIITDKAQNLGYVRNFRINIHLIKNMLIADCYGLVDYDPFFLYPCVGESIHLQFHEIHSVEAFQLIKESYIMWIRKLLGIQYVKLCLQKNKSLPSWMNFEMRNGVIILEGIPANHDIDDLLIRVYNENEYIVQQFQLKIADEVDPEEIKDQQINQKDLYEINSLDDSLFKSKAIDQTDYKEDRKENMIYSQFKITNKQTSQRFLENQKQQSSEIITKSQREKSEQVSMTNIVDFNSYRPDDQASTRRDQLMQNKNENTTNLDETNVQKLADESISKYKPEKLDHDITQDQLNINDQSALEINNNMSNIHQKKHSQYEE
ncbi:kinase domain protein (macronuclear) [Tetrahymena thermophila SB210]|uniref:Kinase domain protein n=1 Tax=Tetrahymena thermophila (strain SB210) TaxID=312017 RepID=I7ME77_TETTS|nr:kinase domain protein [Tetrahymena thermophila SB210]EAR95656.3 kinase domain protein [Tetrahymena thermophila SB210]|eukprot:XP_001015901.3 kinase domain protein [Tetrahymena thermophila SB210]